tara:strand:+ start:1514 stop:2035 length:522 start_codon:yes stop_codon:yes gene_type:complete
MNNKMIEGWEVHIDKSTMFGSTREEVLKRASKQIAKREEEGLPWELHQVWKSHRTKPWPIVLIVGSEDEDCGRPADKWIEEYSSEILTKGRFMWTDSSGTRSVFWYTESKKHSPDYEKDAMDLPVDVFLKLGSYLDMNKVPIHLLLRREDPGIGIILEEDTASNRFSYREDKQ